MKRPAPRGTLALGGMIAGAIVGALDGLRAGIAVGVDVRGGLLAMALAAAVDVLLGLCEGAVLEALIRATIWGRRARARRWAWAVALGVVAVVAGGVTVAAVAATLDRRNRFLAGGIAALAAAAAGIVGAAIAPALARVLSGRRAEPRDPRRPDPALLVVVPLLVAALGAVVLLATARVRAPLRAPANLRLAAGLAVVAAALPALLSAIEALPVRLRLAWAAALAAVVVVGPGVAFVAVNWSEHLRFVPWTDVLVGAAIVVGAFAVAPLVARRLVTAAPASPRPWIFRRRSAPYAGVLVAALVTLAASESEPARKAMARAGLVGSLLAGARAVFDFDHDGYARLFGGGDCNDRDASIHPGVLDFPDDGIDQDCDGQDATAAVLQPPPFAAVPDSVPRDLNLLLVTIDTVRADHLSCYGYRRPTSPAIDALAGDGALFVNGWAHAPSTRYSMPAIATGRWPSAITWDESIWWPRIAPGMRTIAEALKAAGYFTAAFYSYDYFSAAEHRGFERGVDLYRTDRAALHQAVNGPMESRGSSSREMADDTIAFLEGHRAQKFFLWVHFYDPHLSYEPHAEVPSFGNDRMDLYDGEIRFTDLHLGRVLDRLRALGLWDRTAIVVTGDHGEGFGEHGVTEHGFDLYAAQTRVPFIIRVPGLSPRRVLTPAGHVDLAPTLLNLARAPQDHAFLGRSLVPELAGTPPSVAPPPVFQEVTSERGKKRALVTRDWHLIWNWTPDNTTECYDLRVDREELRDRWGRADADPCVGLKKDLRGLVSALSVPPDVSARLKQSVFAPGAPAPAPVVALRADIGDVVTVLGTGAAPPIAHPGGEVEVTLFLECRKPIAGGWRFFFHVLGPGGSFRNLDHVPVDGILPLDRWRPGQHIVDRVKIAFPPGSAVGSYSVIAGLYRGNERLPVQPAAASDGNRAVRVMTISVR